MLRKLKFLGEIIIVTICAYYLGQAAYMVVKPVEIEPDMITQKIDDLKSSKRIDKTQFNIINNRNLFAAFDPAKVKKKPKPKPKPKPKKDLTKLPISSSKLKLTGTIYASEPQLRRAIIIYRGNFEVVKLGDKIADFNIAEIKRRAVILERSKKREILMIDKGDKKIALKSDSGSVLLNKDKFEKVLARPEDILNQVDFAPAKVDGRKGLLINSIEKGSILANIGLRKGDLIVSVNGKTLNSFNDMMSLAKMSPASSVEIKIWRNKRFETLKLKLDNA